MMYQHDCFCLVFFAAAHTHRVCTWLSFDGGFTWSDIAEGTWIYEYADWGGIVVMSKHELNGPADEVCGVQCVVAVCCSSVLGAAGGDGVLGC